MIVESFPGRDAASLVAMLAIADALTRELAAQATATLVVSGGGTPQRCLASLSRSPLDWARVSITLTDERDVPLTDDLSNEAMVRRWLMRDEAAAASFAALTQTNLDHLTRPFACTLVGMGEDGHVASLFPDLPDLVRHLDPDAPPGVITANTKASPVRRVSMNLAALLDSRQILLLAFGEKKKRLLQQPEGLPVAALLNQPATPVRILWAP